MNDRRPRFHWSIRNRIMVPYLALVVALVGGTGLATAHWAAARARQQDVKRGRGIAETLQRSHFPLTEAVLRQLKGLGDAEFALLDEAGRIRSSTLEGLVGQRTDDPFPVGGEPPTRIAPKRVCPSDAGSRSPSNPLFPTIGIIL